MNNRQAESSSPSSWYDVVSATDGLWQGDLLDDFPILMPSPSAVMNSDANSDVPVTVKSLYFNVVVMTQSCDLFKCDDEDQVVLCPRYDYLQIADADSRFAGVDGWKKLVKSRFIHSHLLGKCEIPEQEFDYQVVDLGRIFSVPYSVVRQVANSSGPRIRLNSPYREHLAQAFARQFMRIGLPSDLPRDYPY